MFSRLNTKQFFLVLILFAGIFSCSTQQETQSRDIIREDSAKVSVSDNNITEKYWKLVELNGQKITTTKNRTKEPHFILKAKDNLVVGSGGCNSFRGSYEFSDANKIKFSKMVSTKMACLDTSDMETESKFFKVLETADSYYVHGDTLQLNKAGIAPLAKFEAVLFTLNRTVYLFNIYFDEFFYLKCEV